MTPNFSLIMRKKRVLKLCLVRLTRWGLAAFNQRNHGFDRLVIRRLVGKYFVGKRWLQPGGAACRRADRRVAANSRVLTVRAMIS